MNKAIVNFFSLKSLLIVILIAGCASSNQTRNSNNERLYVASIQDTGEAAQAAARALGLSIVEGVEGSVSNSVVIRCVKEERINEGGSTIQSARIDIEIQKRTDELTYVYVEANQRSAPSSGGLSGGGSRTTGVTEWESRILTRLDRKFETRDSVAEQNQSSEGLNN